MKEKLPALCLPITDLPLSETFKNMSRENDFHTLEDLLSCPVSGLLKTKAFNLHMYAELIHFLEENGLLDHLKQE